MKLAERLRMHRARKDWTPDDLAHASGVSRATIHRAERGSERIAVVVAMRLAKALDITTDELLGMDEFTLEAEMEEETLAADEALVGAR